MTEVVRVQRMELGPEKGSIVKVGINRPESANALNEEILKELASTFEKLQDDASIRLLILYGEGKHFSAGADLRWMKASAAMTREENIEDAKLLSRLFKTYMSLSFPTVALVKGAVYGGAVGLVAASDVVIAAKDSRFCLSEVKLGLLPAVIYPFLARRISLGRLKSLALTANVFNGDEGLQNGLVDLVAEKENLEDAAKDVINQLLTAGPQAQKHLHNLHASLEKGCDDIHDLAVHAISDARTSDEGQRGLKAFFEKKTPHWVSTLEGL